MKHIILFSGGHSSAVVALKVVEKYGKENCILLNHNITSYVEDEDIKRFYMSCVCVCVCVYMCICVAVCILRLPG